MVLDTSALLAILLGEPEARSMASVTVDELIAAVNVALNVCPPRTAG